MVRAWLSLPLWLLALWIIAMTACTSMGSHNVLARSDIDFGPAERLSFCLLVDEGITERAARQLMNDAWREEGALYGLNIEVVSVVPWRRPAYTMQGILDALLQHPLHPQCDRVFALIGRDVGDVVWGLVGLPEVLGAVDDNTSTHGYAVVPRALCPGAGRSNCRNVARNLARSAFPTALSSLYRTIEERLSPGILLAPVARPYSSAT